MLEGEFIIFVCHERHALCALKPRSIRSKKNYLSQSSTFSFLWQLDKGEEDSDDDDDEDEPDFYTQAHMPY